MRTLAVAVAVATAALAGSLCAQDAAQPTSTYFDGAKITITERARANGFMRVRVVPENGSPREATFAIERRMNENELARGVADALNTVLGPEYVADRDAGEHVKIHKKAKDASDFSVEITFNVPGFAVVLDN
jgi:hypothetical protein